MRAGIVVQPGAGEVLDVVGEHIRILIDSKQSGGDFVIFEDITGPRNGPPLHRHGKDDELFYIVEGTLKFVIDGRESIVGPGSVVFAPRGSVHTYMNMGKTPSRMIVTCTPGGIEEPFRAANALGRTATNEQVSAAFRAFDLTIVGPPLRSAN